jgi:hypothetical protein
VEERPLSGTRLFAWEIYAALKRPLFHGCVEGEGRKQADSRTGEDARHSIEISGRESG